MAGGHMMPPDYDMGVFVESERQKGSRASGADVVQLCYIVSWMHSRRPQICLPGMKIKVKG